MKTLLISIGVLFGTGIGLMFAPPLEVVEPGEYVPVPNVGVSCHIWVVEETGPSYFWDGEGTEDQTSTADYWTVETLAANGGTIRSAPATRREAIEVEPSANGTVNVVWWDSDRAPYEPMELNRVAAKVEPCAD